jgi:hypothetical protein
MGSNGQNSCSSLVTLTDPGSFTLASSLQHPLLLPLLLSFPFVFFYEVIFKGTWLSGNEHLATLI